MTPTDSEREPVEKLAEEFAERYRRGERPALAEYTQRYPELAAQIRELFPALVVMEEFGSVAGPVTGPFAPPAEADKVVPLQLGEYRILREVGHGGMGVVFEAVQESLGRHVALKVLPVHGKPNPMLLERFRREARAAARLHHTNIVPVFGVGEASGIHYYAMQFIQGHSLDGILHELRRTREGKADPRKGDLGALTPPNQITVTLAQCLLTGITSAAAADDPERAEQSDKAPPKTASKAANGGAPTTVRVRTAGHASPPSTHSELTTSKELAYYRSVARLGLQAAEALAYAHEQGILHRDVKPSNLLLDTRGTVWITDFGLAKANDNAELTQLGDILGTLRYMAPERFRGQSEPRSDIYSLGATLYELLTLQAAFESSDRVRLIEQITHEDPLPPRRCDRRIPRDLETIVLKAMAKEPGDRYADATSLAEDLRRFLADRPILARRTSVVERTWRWCRRNPALATLTASVALLLVVLAVGSSLANIWLAEEHSRVVAESNRAHEAENDLRAEKDSTTQLLDSYLGQLKVNRGGRQPGHRWKPLEMLGGLAARHPSLELRNEAIAFLMYPDLRIGPAWELEPGWRNEPFFDRALQRYAVSDGNNQVESKGHISIRRLPDHQEVMRLEGFGVRIAFMMFSPNGQFLAVKYDDARDVQFWVWDLERREAVVKERRGINHAAVDFSPDQRSVAVGHPDGSVRIYDLPSGKLARSLVRGLPAHSLRYDPAGHRLAVTSLTTPGVELRDLETDKLVTLPNAMGIRGLAWRSDGRLLATAGANGLIYLWDLANPRQAPTLLRGHEAEVSSVVFNHTGDLLASSAWDGTTRLWNVADRRLLLSAPSVWASHFSPDDRYLAAGREGAKVWLWEVIEARECRTFTGHTMQPRSAAVSPDARLLASAGVDGIRLWDLACKDEGRKLLALLPVQAFTVVFHPDGQSLISSGPPGLLRWPIARATEASGELIRIGPPDKLGPADLPPLEMAVLAPDGNRIAVNLWGRACLVALGQGGQPLYLQGQPGLTLGNFSPDGKWFVTGNWQGDSGVWIWDARAGKPIRKMALTGSTRACFSPDGKWLVTSTGTEYVFWEPGSWKSVRTIGREGAANMPSDPLFSPDGLMLALAHSRTDIRLVDPATGQELVSLPTSGSAVCFSGDGSLLVTGSLNKVLQVWDLREIRRQLAALNLDWQAPAFRPVDSLNARPLRVQKVDLGVLNSAYQARIDQQTKLLAENPNNAFACNQLAWLLLTGPEAFRDPKKALPLAQKAVQLFPKRGLYANTLGVAFYRLGQHQSAVDVLEPSRPFLEAHLQPFNLFCLAMSYHQLGSEAKARDCYQRAVVLVQEHSPRYSVQQRQEMSDFQSEAEAVLALAKK
jgi:serine/threonine protein kinase/WD40 repeat protein